MLNVNCGNLLRVGMKDYYVVYAYCKDGDGTTIPDLQGKLV